MDKIDLLKTKRNLDLSLITDSKTDMQETFNLVKKSVSSKDGLDEVRRNQIFRDNLLRLVTYFYLVEQNQILSQRKASNRKIKLYTKLSDVFEDFMEVVAEVAVQTNESIS